MDFKDKIGFIYSWRWFGHNDPLTFEDIKTAGASGIVTALHHIPSGDVWPEEEILKRKNEIEKAGLTWEVVESLPVHENIKKKKDNYKQLIENYKTSLINLAKCNVKRVCYNFMPVLDWSRTNLDIRADDGSIVSGFETRIFAAFDIFILKRKGAETDYSEDTVKKAEKYFSRIGEDEKQRLIDTVLLGLPGSLEAYTLEEFRKALDEYKDINDATLLNNLKEFLKEITPVAEENGILLAIHPDDPPRPLLGLPRVVSTCDNLTEIVKSVESPSNGITLCTGSLGSGVHNNVTEIAARLARHVNFVHLRNVIIDNEGNFRENHHLEGSVDMYNVVKILLLEQKRRLEEGLGNYRMPMRPDHGKMTHFDKEIEKLRNKKFYPGYSFIGRLKGLSELQGLEVGIKYSL
ncbi:mannonate dehydratase [Melioribacter roseus P3M-2]|uniref:Mannonate dehydratase n=1 Tax=Melioribacter roseus (strain DSM 23840 / JCM 17771 / VKM B-2668 / P3M-2) TaxID=1191523 RepID=I6ZAA9_MELRP|nr:mannonate dehydratase [Melioribacter roseus]AFN76075.1 mannonate dehydratase [Melioribacter roseus P3M-2]